MKFQRKISWFLLKFWGFKTPDNGNGPSLLYFIFNLTRYCFYADSYTNLNLVYRLQHMYNSFKNSCIYIYILISKSCLQGIISRTFLDWLLKWKFFLFGYKRLLTTRSSFRSTQKSFNFLNIFQHRLKYTYIALWKYSYYYPPSAPIFCRGRSLTRYSCNY